MESLNLHNVPDLKDIYIFEGIKLRPLDQSDTERILEILASDRSIRDKVTVASRLYAPEDVKTEIERYHKDANLIRYALLKQNSPIGLVSLWRDDGFSGTPPQLDDYGFGYFLDPNERGKGFITRAVQTLMDTVTKKFHVNQFVAFCEDSNSDSIAVLTKLGFERTNILFREPYNGWIERKYIKPVIQ